MFHGVKNFDGQIATHLEMRKHNRSELRNLMNISSDNKGDNRMENFIKNTFFKDCYTESGLIKPNGILYSSLKKYEF